MHLTLNLLTTTIVAPPSNASKWQMGFNSAFKWLTELLNIYLLGIFCQYYLLITVYYSEDTSVITVLSLCTLSEHNKPYFQYITQQTHKVK